MSHCNNTDIDSDPILIIQDTNIKKCNTGDLYQLSNKIYELLNLKIAFILFLLYYILNSDIFIDLALNNIFNNCYDRINDKVTEKGIVITGLFLVLCYIVIDLLDKKNII